MQGRADAVQQRIREYRRRDAHCGYPIEFLIKALPLGPSRTLTESGAHCGIGLQAIENKQPACAAMFGFLSCLRRSAASSGSQNDLRNTVMTALIDICASQSQRKACSGSAVDMYEARYPHAAESPASTPNLGSREGNECRLQPELRSAGRAEPRRPSGELPGDLRKSGRAWTSCPTAQESGERRAPFCTNAVHQRGDLVQERIAIRRRCHVRNRRCPVVDLVPNNRCAGKARSAA